MSRAERRTKLAAFPILLLLGMGSLAPAASGPASPSYRYYAGDFDGDGVTDILYVSQTPGWPSGIVLSDSQGFNRPLQSWGDDYLGIPWTHGQYRIVVADFNGDRKSDVFLQRLTPGDHYLLLTEEGGLGGISQTIAENAAGIAWSAPHHRILAGNFDGQGGADLFFQPTSDRELAAVLASDADGRFTGKLLTQSWEEGYAGFQWNTERSNVFIGDFNGDSIDDLLIQALPIRNENPDALPALTFAPKSHGVVLAQRETPPGAGIFVLENAQAWDRDGFGADWAPFSSEVLIGDFNNDHRFDVFLRGLAEFNPDYLLQGQNRGPIFAPAIALDKSAAPSSEATAVLVGDFSGTGRAELYAIGSQGAFWTRFDKSGKANRRADTSLAATIEAAASSPAFNPEGVPGGRGGGMAAALAPVTAAGRTRGEFSVSSTGSATYHIPLWTPAGARELQPSLALVYSSGSGDGPLGPGWGLSGLSSLSRCSKTYASNGGQPSAVALATNDDLCLDGNLLRLTSGTQGVAGSTYQTEIATFGRVTAYSSAGNGPSYFIVEGKDGLKYEYGNSTDSKAYPIGGSTPYAWLLSKVVDRQGNNLKVTYFTTNGDTQPLSIQYTQVPSKSATYPYTVAFVYQNRVTNLSQYVAGQKIEQTKVLSKINVNHGIISVRQYNLEYETAPTTIRDRLKSVQECGGSAGTDCLRPTIIAYQNGQAGVAAPTNSLAASSTGRVSSSDVNGDGRTDLLYSTGSESAALWYVRFANADGTYASAVGTGMTASSNSNSLFGDFYGDGKFAIVAPVAGVWNVTRWNGSAFVTQSLGISFDASSSNVLADTDGDGLPDLVTLRTDTKIYIRRNLSTQYSPSLGSASMAYSLGKSPTTDGAYLLSDFENAPAGSMPGARIIDVNGDGRQDVVVYSLTVIYIFGTPIQFPSYSILLGSGSTLSFGLDYGSSVSLAAAGNVNGDQCTDLVTYNAVYIAACNGAASQNVSLVGAFIGVIDWDGDGADDMLLYNGGNVQVSRSLGGAFATPVSTGLTLAVGDRYIGADSNGDALGDLIQKTASGALSYGLHAGAGTPPDLVTSITDGWGIAAAPTYVSIAQSNHTKSSGALLPDYDFQGSYYVVSSATMSNGLGATFTQSFQYSGARMNRQGRGFLGFATTRMNDGRTGLYHFSSYLQEHPYIGHLAIDDLRRSDATTSIRKTTYTYDNLLLAGADCGSGRCFPYVKTSTTNEYELTAGAPWTKSTVTQYTYDSYGNTTQISTTITDKDAASPFSGQSWTSVVNNTITNNTANWCLGKPSATSTVNTAPGQTAVTRESSYAIDYSLCRVTEETVEPNSTALKVVTTFGFDSCGNLSSTSIVGRNAAGTALPARTTTMGYGTRCQFAETVTNGLGQTGSTVFNYNFGTKASVTDPNGVSTSWTYDNFGRPLTEVRPDTTRTSWSYADCASAPCWGLTDLRFQVTETLQESSLATIRTRVSYFDGMERHRQEQGHGLDGTWLVAQAVYDSVGRVSIAYLPYSSANNGYTTYTYDALSRPTLVKLFNASGVQDRQASIAYAGQKTTVTDFKSNVTVRWNDVTEKLRVILDPSPGATTTYTYDSFGNLKQMVDPIGAVTTNIYNVRGFKTSMSDPDAGNWTYTPNSLNELTSQQDAKGQVTSFTYDVLGRLVSRLEPESGTATTFTYGTSASNKNIGWLQSVSKPDGYGESYAYDSIGRPQQTTYTMDSTSYQVNYTYNSQGAVDVLTYPTSTSGYRFALKYLYSYGYLKQVKDNAAGTIFWTLDQVNDSGAPKREILGNNVKVISDYKPWTNELLTRNAGTNTNGDNLQKRTYTWDANGNLSQRQDLLQNLTEVISTDSLNRVTSSTLNGSTNLTMTYDASGNVTYKHDAGSTIGSFDYTTPQAGCTYYAHAQPHAVRKAGSMVYCYDANGNVTSRNGGSISWYSYNLPDQISYAGNSTRFFYNHEHQRWKQVANYAGVAETTRYIGGIMEKVERGSAPAEYRHYIPGGSNGAIYTRRSDGTSSTFYVTTDHLGSGDLIMDSSANVLARESFTAFGARRGSNWQGNPTAGDYTTFQNTTRRGFTGHEMLDSVSLVHMNGRVYDPYVGRFLSPDPIIQTLALSQALNPFSYTINNPLKYIDPSGYSWLSKLFKSVGRAIKSFVRGIARSLNFIVGAVLMVVGTVTGNYWLVNLGRAIASFPVQLRYNGRQFQVGFSVMNLRLRMGEGFIGLPVTADSPWFGGSKSSRDPNTIGGVQILHYVDPNYTTPEFGWNLYTVFAVFVPGYWASVEAWAAYRRGQYALALAWLAIAGAEVTMIVGTAGTGYGATAATKAGMVGGGFAIKATAATRASQIQSVLGPRTQRSVTTSVTETSQGVRVVTSSEGRLRPAQRAAMQPGEVAGVGQRGVHAEVNGVNAAKDMGLTPTAVAPSRPACPACIKVMEELGISILGP